MNRQVFLRDVDDVIHCYNNKDEAGTFKVLHRLLDFSPCLEEIHETILRDSATTWRQLFDITKVLSLVHRYSADDYAKIEVSRIALACYARAFILCPIKQKHIIAYSFNNFIDNTYFSKHIAKFSCTEYNSHISYYFTDFSLDDPDCKEIYMSNMYDSPKGKVICYNQRIAKLIQWFILCHVKSLNKINPKILPVNSKELSTRIKECYKYLCNIESSKLKRFAIQLFSYLFEDFSDEGLGYCFGGDNYSFQFNEDNLIEMHDTWLEALAESEEEYNRHLESEDMSSYENEEEYDGYGQYQGSYAQDVMGYSDDEIDTIFDGDPDAYWNID